MAGWSVDDPELIATFRAEVEERLASLQAGLLALEGNQSPRQAVAGLFRDAHTVKGSARMLGLHGVLEVAHTCEDLLAALRDGRFAVRTDLVDLLLAACDAIGRTIPGAVDPLDETALEPLLAVLKEALAGHEGLVPPVLFSASEPGVPLTDAETPASDGRGGDSMRISAAKVYDLLDAVGEAELSSRRVERAVAELIAGLSEQERWARMVRAAAVDVCFSGEGARALRRLLSRGAEQAEALRALRELVELDRDSVARVRDDAMGLAMVPVRRVFAALPRIARDVASATGKNVRIVLSGEDVELDKQVLDGVADALKHLVINAVDHGCELPAVRRSLGKPATSVIEVAARAAGATVVLEVSDDGSGIDDAAVRAAAVARGLLAPDSTASGPALWRLMFTAAFSTAADVTETSGRGVGLDVVRSAVEELGGGVEVFSTPGRGTTFRMTLPVTLGVLRCLVARVGGERFAIPVTSVVESFSLRDAEIHRVADAPVIVRHDHSVPLLDLGSALAVPGDRTARCALVTRHGEAQLAWAVDRLEGEQELVVKEIGPFLGRLPLVPGATIDGDGSVVCLLDLRELADQVTGGIAGGAHADLGPAAAESAAPQQLLRVLVVEDSVGVRELERVILSGAGYEVTTAVDGMDAAERLSGEPVDLVVTDVEMPGMDGFELTRTIRQTPGWARVPVVVMTSRGDDADQRAGLAAGANAYLLKQEFDQHSLVETVRRLIGPGP